jgi:hypothetical protein
MAPGTRRSVFDFRLFDFRFFILEEAGQAGIKSVGRTGLKGNDCIRTARAISGLPYLRQGRTRCLFLDEKAT